MDSKNTLRNRKAQFFIASAVIIIAFITLIMHFVSQQEFVNTPDIAARDMGFFLNNLKEEYGKTVELVFSEYTRDTSINPDDGLTKNLSVFEDLLQNISAERGISINASSNILTTSTTKFNVSVNINALTQNNRIYMNFYVVRGINVTIETGTIVTNPVCIVNTTVKKEYEEPLLYMDTAILFDMEINNTAAEGPCSTVGLGNGMYKTQCAEGCVNSLLRINATDNRNVFGTDTYNT